MKLKSVEILNFRSFMGDFFINFSTQEDKKITAFIGENGGGKTNLLNAIFWCLTGDVTQGLDMPNMLVNNEAKTTEKSFGGNADAYVEVAFENNGKNYKARRTLNKPNYPPFEIDEIDKNGNSRKLANPGLLIEGIIPKALSNWFFYDVEAIQNMTLDGSDDFKSALRKTFNFDLLEKTIADLSLCHSKKTKEIKSLTKPQELKDLEEAIDNINRTMPTNEAKLKEATQHRRDWDSKLNLINIELAKSDKAKELQSRRVKNENNLDLVKKRKVKIVNQIAYIDGQSFPNIFLNKASEGLRNFIKIEEDKGKVPSPYSEVLLNDILHDEKCICDNEVKKGSKEERALVKKLATATTSILNDRKNKIIYAIQQTNILKDSYSTEIFKLRDDLKLANEEIASINEDLNAIEKDLAMINEEKIAQLEKDRANAKDNYGKAYHEVEYFSGTLEKQKQQLKLHKEKQKLLLSRSGLQKNVADELDKIERLQSFIESNLEQQEKDALVILEEEINKYLIKYLTKHYTASVSHDNYEISLFDEKKRRVPKSRGEGEVLKYAFISAMMAIVGNKSDRKLNSLVKPTLAPLVMDAPFTSLGDEYKRSTAIDITHNASQLILLMLPNVLSDPDLSDAIIPSIGKTYAVISQQTGPQGNKPIISKKIFGKVIHFNEFNCNYSGTKIEEIKNV